MPWVDNGSLDAAYLRITWRPPASQVGDAVAFAYTLPMAGLEYEDGEAVDAPFTDIPIEPGPPFVRVYLPHSEAAVWLERIVSACEARGWELDWDEVKSQDWANAWKAYYQPQWVGADYVIVPSWHQQSPADPDHTLWLDPGMAFGTGTHATTRMCLNVLASDHLKGRRVLDLGAGSGILGLFAALRGSSEVLLVEPDPVAVDAIRYNIGLNRLGAVEVIAGTLADVPKHRFDVLCLNLIWDIISAEWPNLQPYLAPGAQVLLSGLLPERRDALDRLLASTGHVARQVQEEDGWMLVEVRHDPPVA